jgi:hypothetical protein
MLTSMIFVTAFIKIIASTFNILNKRIPVSINFFIKKSKVMFIMAALHRSILLNFLGFICRLEI